MMTPDYLCAVPMLGQRVFLCAPKHLSMWTIFWNRAIHLAKENSWGQHLHTIISLNFSCFNRWFLDCLSKASGGGLSTIKIVPRSWATHLYTITRYDDEQLSLKIFCVLEAM